MRTLAVFLAVALTSLLLVSAAPLHVYAQNANGQAPMQADSDTPRRTVKAFAPFIRAIVGRRMNVAERIFKIRRNVQGTLELPNTVRILGRFQRPDQLEMSFIGGRTLGRDVGILLFTVVTEDGPVAFRVNYYGFGNDMWVARMEVSDDWDDIERLALTVDPLPQGPVTTSLGGQIDENPPATNNP